MRKTIIALMIVLPMCFVLVLFSSVNIVSLNVNVSVNGIQIVTDRDEDYIVLDMADKEPRVVSAKVTPGQATEKEYTLSSSDESVLTIKSDGTLVGNAEGKATVTATSKDQGYTDSIDVSVTSSKPYDLDFSLFDVLGDEVELNKRENSYSASIETGRYAFSAAVHPVGYEYSVEVDDEETFAEIDMGQNTVFLPFNGTANLTLTVKDGIIINGDSVKEGDIVKKIKLNVFRNVDADDILVNGNLGSATVLMAKGDKNVSVYVESVDKPVFQSISATCTEDNIEYLGSYRGRNRYKLDITVDDDEENGFDATITCGGATASVGFEFKDYDFSVSAGGINIEKGVGGYVAAVEQNKKITFYAVPAVNKSDVEYAWELTGGKNRIEQNGKECVFYADEKGKCNLKVKASSNGITIIENTIEINVVEMYFSILMPGDKNVGYAECYTIGGYRYENENKVENSYKLGIVQLAYNPDYDGQGEQTKNIDNTDELEISVSDPEIAKYEVRDGSVYLVAVGTGKATVSVAWKWNDNFGKQIKEVRTFAFAKDAVAVDNAPDLVKATSDGEKVVLKSNIMLGTDKSGNKYSVVTLENMLGKMKSTYNTEWYKESGKASEANISYVMEFKNDVYGNGYNINAEYFTHCVDDTESPLIKSYKDPLYFVNLGNTASVSAQDNCAFLIRTDNVTLYGVNLLGCSDESLYENGNYNLNRLNHVGTTLDINGNGVNILNCRIRNGRNVIRIYGGNRDGSKYFIENLSENANGVDNERIKVRIEGCYITQGREFLIKIGANKALRASVKNGQQPPLCDAQGKPYISKDGAKSNFYEDLYKDDYFYSHYVMTDVTLKDSVLETSGLFVIGVESNFAGDLLYKGATSSNYRDQTKTWQLSGGTSFASVLRLEGDVRLYDWKDFGLIDSSTLIEAPTGILRDWLNLDLKSMLDFVHSEYPEEYGQLILKRGDKEFVHGGIAFYGGGINYSQLVTENLNAELKDLTHHHINISVLEGAKSGTNMHKQGQLLPLAAGTYDFNFYMYDTTSANSYDAQQKTTNKSAGIKPIPFFELTAEN